MPSVTSLPSTDADLARGLASLLGRRALLRASATGALAGGGAAYASAPAAAAARSGRGQGGRRRVLQPGSGPAALLYVRARAGEVLWGRLPHRTSTPVATVDSGAVVTLDTISHEGLLEDQGKDPRGYSRRTACLSATC
ncbi:MAG: hypothetical protein LH468_09700 [Nocardioides sp.]|nr:hypothetical protein [Nocardioides sp.]